LIALGFPGLTQVAAVKNQEMMRMAPVLLRYCLHQLFLRLLRSRGNADAYAIGHPEDMGIYGNGRQAESIAENYICCFSAHAGQGFQFLPAAGHFTLVLLHQLPASGYDIGSLIIVQTAAMD
jgi:hypothetical protein